METLIERMSKYTKKLQEAVEERSVEIVKEKMKCDELLSKMLPRYIYIIKVLHWHDVHALLYKCVCKSRHI